MKRVLFLVLATSLKSFCQPAKVPLDKAFIDKTIEYYYATKAKKYKGTSTFFIEKDSLTKTAKTDYGVFKVQFLSADEATQKIPAAQKDSRRLDRLLIRWISLDTIDVVITGCTVGQRKTNITVGNKPVVKTENFLTNCTDQFVDIPTCRFVYDPTTTRWAQINRGKEVK